MGIIAAPEKAMRCLLYPGDGRLALGLPLVLGCSLLLLASWLDAILDVGVGRYGDRSGVELSD